jgi:hypothetical protein
MSEAVSRIGRLERRVMWRRRLLSLQDRLAMSTAIGGILAAALVFLVRMRALQIPVWALVLGVLGLSTTAALARWFFSRADEQDAAFLIDESLGLEDRVATAHLIIERGGPKGALEEALIEDTADRAGDQPASSVIPLRMRQWHALAPVSLIALVAALMITPRTLPVTEALAAERADVDNAADHLERTAAEVEQIVPVGTETARLANEQAELGRGLRRSAATRAEALKRLSGLEERIRRWHDELESTHADEIVTLADRRLGGALTTLSRAKHKKPQADEDKLAVSADGPLNAPKREPGKENQPVRPSADKAPNSSPANENSGLTASKGRARPGDDRPKVEDAKKREATDPQNKPQEPASRKDPKIDKVRTAAENPGKAGAESDKTTGDQRPGDLKPNTENAAGQKNAERKNAEREEGEQQPGDKVPSASDALKSAPDFLVNQAIKALPKLSEDLLKKVAQLRANELSPADIEKLRQAAESLSRDLAQIAQSKDLQRALQEMARQVRPEQIEQVARELVNQEKLKQELESAARLLSENQQSKEMVAGLAGEFARVRDEMKKQQRNEKAEGQKAGESHSRNEQTGANDRASRSGAGKSPDNFNPPGERRFAEKGRESSLQGTLQQRSRGEYLYLQSKAGRGAARAPYSSAYPQYRREAERSVQRTQVPPNLRSVVRKYFDAINPDSKR